MKRDWPAVFPELLAAGQTDGETDLTALPDDAA